MKWMVPMMLMATAGPAAAADPAFDRAVAAVEARLAAIDTVPDVIPGRAVVMVKAGAAPRIDVRGTTHIDGGTPLTPDTPMYIASMTKAFVGMMAVRLDERGVLPLDTRLGAIFPNMKVEGVDVGQLTMRDLLSHQLGFEARALNLRTAYTDTVPVADYPRIVNAVGSATKPGFDYSNLGYLLYGAALEKKTGKSWRRWIDETLFAPLGMQHSSARTSDFRDISFLHERFEDGWRTYRPKDDRLMHAAGGLVVSPADMARWLAANAGAPSSIPAATFAKAHEGQVAVDQKRGPMRCTAYAFGWNRCEVFGLKFLEHGGGYTGMRSEMVVLPDQGVAFAAMFNSDNMTGGLSGQLMQVFMSAFAGQTEGLPTPEQMRARYVADTGEYRSNRSAAERKALADPRWGGWAWQPTGRQLARYAGTYRSPAFGALRLATRNGTLTATFNGMPVTLRPAKPDLFGATLVSNGELEPLKVIRDARGRIERIEYSGIDFSAR